MSVLEKARLFCPDSNELDFQFMFNPDKVQFKEAVKVGESESARTDSGRPKVSFEYPKARTLRLKKVMFDTYESGEDIMATYIDPLRQSVQFQGYSTGDSYLPRPPIYKFIWGDKDYITCFVEKLNYKLTMFLADGTPVRAEVNLNLKEVDDSFLSSQARTYDENLFGDRDTRTQPPEPVSVQEANEYYLNDLKEKCQNGTQAAEDKREEAKESYDPEAKVQLFEHPNKGGNKVELGEGKFDTGDLGDLGNDSMSSFYIPAGYTVTFYTDPDFRGASFTVSGENYTADLEAYTTNIWFVETSRDESNWGDRVSSLIITVDEDAKNNHDQLMREAEALESNSSAACDEYQERLTWYS